MRDQTKLCPYCAETIQEAAIVCRFCNRDLTAASTTPPLPVLPTYYGGSPDARSDDAVPDDRIHWKAVARDVALVTGFTLIGGFLVGLSAGMTHAPLNMVAIALSNLIMATLAFVISGCLTRRHRMRHAALVALLTWPVGLVNLAIGGISLTQWMLSLIPLEIMAMAGAGLSFLFVRNKP